MNLRTFGPASGADLQVFIDVEFLFRASSGYAERAAGGGLRPHFVDKPRFSATLARRGHRFSAQAFIFGLRYRNSVGVAEIFKSDAVSFPSGECGKRGNETNSEREKTDLQGDVGGPRGATATKSAGITADKVVPIFCPMAIPVTRTRGRKSSGNRLGNTPLKPW